MLHVGREGSTGRLGSWQHPDLGLGPASSLPHCSACFYHHLGFPGSSP